MQDPQKSKLKTKYSGPKLNLGNRAFCLWLLFLFLLLSSGCISENVTEDKSLVRYQEKQIGRELRRGTAYQDPNHTLDLLKPASAKNQTLPEIEMTSDPNTGEKIASLTIEEAIARVLVNSPEIRVVSFDPSVSRLDITRAVSEFDFMAFGDLNYETEDNPDASIYQIGQSNSKNIDAGIRQKFITGSQWSLTYAFTRNWDDLAGRMYSTRYEPILSFQMRQPLLQNAWQNFNMAGIDIAKLNYKVAMLGFRQKAQDVTTQAISAYWQLVQARRNLEIYKVLLAQTLETLEKVEGRRQIDATDVQIKQAQAYAKSRQASLIQAEKMILDQQDSLVRLMSDSKLNLLEKFIIVPSSKPALEKTTVDSREVLETMLRKNPVIQQARAGIEIADINIRIAQNQKMPKLDLVTSLRTQDVASSPGDAFRRMDTGDYVSYGIGLSLEYPLGNRKKEAELLQRRLERRKAAVNLENIADQAAQLAKEDIRRIETDFAEIEKQKQATEDALAHLQALEESEIIRERLTPEFLLLKLQAQEFLANAQIAEIRAIADYNIALAEMSRIMGTVLELHLIEPVQSENTETDKTNEKLVPVEMN